MKWVLLALQCAVLAGITRAHLWHRLPAFGCYMAATIPLVVSYQPAAESWWHGFFAYQEPLLILLRTWVTIEAMLLAVDRWERMQLRDFLLILCALGGTMSISAWGFHSHLTWFSTVRDLRAAEYIRLSLTCLICLALSFRQPSQGLFTRLHFALWTIMVTRQACVAVLGRIWGSCWHPLDVAAYIVAYACLTLWFMALTADHFPDRQSLGDRPRILPYLVSSARHQAASVSR